MAMCVSYAATLCKEGVCGSMSCCVGICCKECSWLGVRRMYNRTKDLQALRTLLHTEKRYRFISKALAQKNNYL